MNQIINVQNNNGELLVRARDIHKELKITERFNNWFKRQLQYGFENGLDFYECDCSVELNNKAKRKLNDYFITINMAKGICILNKNNNKDYVFKILNEIEYNEICIMYRDRKEIEFGKLLKGITNMDWKEQYPIENGKYRLDFYLEDTLIVEYQEKHHKYQNEKDLIRIKECVKWLSENECDDNWKCPVIFVEEGKELEGLNRIIRHLAGFEKFDTQYDYNLEVCERL